MATSKRDVTAKVMRVCISHEVLKSILVNPLDSTVARFKEVTSNVPADAKIVGAAWNRYILELELWLVSETFATYTGPWNRAPLLAVQYTTTEVHG